MKEAPTAYSLLIMHKDVIYAVRDPYGNRPLCIGRLIPISDINDKGNELQKKYNNLIMLFQVIVLLLAHPEIFRLHFKADGILVPGTETEPSPWQ